MADIAAIVFVITLGSIFSVLLAWLVLWIFVSYNGME